MRWLVLLWVLPASASADRRLWTERPRARAAGPRQDFARLANAVAPAVVNVSVGGNATTPGQAAALSVGTGFVIRSDGLALTGWHVLEGGGAIRVKTADGQSLDATIVGADDRTEIGRAHV